MTGKVRTAILISGRGSNMAALIDAARAADFPAQIALVFSNVETAEGLKIAADAGVGNTILEITPLKPLVPSGLAMSDMALRWCLDFDAVSVVIPGAKNSEQARANARASTLPLLGAALHAKLADFYAREVAANIRGSY